MNPSTTCAFDLPDHLTAKADPALIGGDEQHFAAIGESLEQSIADLSDRLDAERKAPGGIGQEARNSAGTASGPAQPLGLGNEVWPRLIDIAIPTIVAAMSTAQKMMAM